PLTYMHTQAELPTTIANWRETLLKFDFQCVYRPGLKNVIPDALSRAFPSALWNETSDDAASIPTPPAKYQMASVTTPRHYRFVKTKSAHLAAISTRSAKAAKNSTPKKATAPIQPSRFNPEANPASAPEYITSSQLVQVLDGDTIDANAPYLHQIPDPDRQFVVPAPEDQNSLLDETHNFGHLGANAM
ncbi:hypothetical protein BGZ99_003127, partial [Dissophora globulifera]